MITFKKHHKDELDGTRSAWRPTIIASMFGVDGHPVAWKELAVFSCPGCGCQQGVGGDAVQVQNTGVTDGPVTCHHCGWSDSVTFEHWDQTKGREHFAKIKADATDSVAETRIRTVRDEMKKDLLANLDARALAEAKKILPDGDPNHQEIFKNFMKNRV